MSGSIPNCVIKSSSIHRSFNRAVALHGVHDVLVESNVAYDVMGHAYFLEDAIETRNTFAYNLAVLTRPSNALLSTDQTVAAPELELIPRRLSARLATPRNRLVSNAFGPHDWQPAAFWITNVDNQARSRAPLPWLVLSSVLCFVLRSPARLRLTRPTCPAAQSALLACTDVRQRGGGYEGWVRLLAEAGDARHRSVGGPGGARLPPGIEARTLRRQRDALE